MELVEPAQNISSSNQMELFAIPESRRLIPALTYSPAQQEWLLDVVFLVAQIRGKLGS